MLQRGIAKLMILLFIVCFFSVAVLSQFRVVAKLANEEEKIKAEIAKEEQIKEELNATLDSYGTDEFVEKAARDQLGFIKDDEIVFIIEK